jgi:hypothetical protein
MPYANETLYVIVANSWDTLLQFSVRALILDGKRVLPLRWTCPAPGKFEFSVFLDLFEFDFIRNYDPFYALSAAIFACTRPTRQRAAVASYFGWHLRQALADCRRMQQSGFLLTWSRPYCDGATLNTILLTLNQHWRESEYLPSDFMDSTADQRPGIVDVIYNRMERVRASILFGSEDDDIYRLNQAADVHSRLFPQNGSSYEILDRRRNRNREDFLRKRNAGTHSFETADYANLKHVVTMLTAEGGFIYVEEFAPFGELEDYVRQTSGRPWRDLDDILDLLYAFRAHKGYSEKDRFSQAM